MGKPGKTGSGVKLEKTGSRAGKSERTGKGRHICTIGKTGSRARLGKTGSKPEKLVKTGKGTCAIMSGKTGTSKPSWGRMASRQKARENQCELRS